MAALPVAWRCATVRSRLAWPRLGFGQKASGQGFQVPRFRTGIAAPLVQRLC